MNATIHALTPKLQPADGRCKSRTKIDSESKKKAVNHTIFAGRPTKLAGLIVCASFMLDLPYLAHISSISLA